MDACDAWGNCDHGGVGVSASLEEWEAELLAGFKDADGNFPERIDAKDVRVGDRLVRLAQALGGDAVLRIGTVDEVGNESLSWANSRSGFRLVTSGESHTFLLERPTPPLPSEEGATVLVSYYEDEPVRWLRTLRDGDWYNALGDQMPLNWTAWAPVAVGETVTPVTATN